MEPQMGPAGFIANVSREDIAMSFRFTQTLLMSLWILGASWVAAATSAAETALERALGPEELLRLEQDGSLTVRALGAWGRLPAQFVSMGQTLRSQTGLNLLDASTEEVAGWLAQAESGDPRLHPFSDGLKEMLDYLRRGDFLDWEVLTDEGAAEPGTLLRRDGRRWVHGGQDTDLATALAPSDPSGNAGSGSEVLFGGDMSEIWVPHQVDGGKFNDFAKIDQGMLVADVPAGAQWGKVGVYSPGPVLWLDGFGPGAEVGVSFEFDPARTTGFVVALSPHFNLKNNNPSRPYLWVQWNLKEDGSGGKAQVLITPDFPKAAWEWETSAKAPDKVTLSISPEGVLVGGFGAPEERMPWKCVMPNMGFRVYAFSQARETGQPVRMALKRIFLDRTPGAAPPANEPAPGVEPLETRTLFPDPDAEAWEPYGIRGADFAKYGRFEDGRLVAEIPADAFGWPKVGLVSKNPVISFNERILHIPYDVRIACDPARTGGVEAVFRSTKIGDMEKSPEVMASFVRHASGPDAGAYVLSLSGDNTIYRNWSRRVDADWVDRHWDGVLNIRFGDGWVEAGLSGGPAVRGMDLRTGKDMSYHMAVTSCPATKNGASSLVLERVVGGWASPPGMTAVERWNFVDDEGFDAEAFVNDLAEGLGEP